MARAFSRSVPSQITLGRHSSGFPSAGFMPEPGYTDVDALDIEAERIAELEADRLDDIAGDGRDWCPVLDDDRDRDRDAAAVYRYRDRLTMPGTRQSGRQPSRTVDPMPTTP